MGGESFAGVDLANIGSEAPAPNTENLEVSAGSPPAEDAASSSQSQSPELPDLDKLERFRFDGRELTPKELKAAYMRHSDYTKKTQEIARERTFARNFNADLRRLIKEPQLMDKFKEIYPSEYVQWAEELLEQNRSENPVQDAQGSEQSPQMHPELRQALKEIQDYKAQVREQQNQATLEHLNSLHSRFESKYPYASPQVVDVMLTAAVEQFQRENPQQPFTNEMLQKAMENAYKEHHNQLKSRIDSQQKRKVEDQVKAGKMARDIGKGGSPPAMPPKKYGSISEVTTDYLKTIER